VVWLRRFGGCLSLVFTVTVCLNAQRYGTLPVPEANPLTPAKIALGKRLFSDPRLSADGSLSCATCHNPGQAFADHRTVSRGVFGRLGDRNVPTLIGRGYGTLQLLDGRAASLEEQVIQPITHPREMGASMDTVLQRLRSDYTALTAESLADALASYVRTIQSLDAPFDRHMSGAPGGLSDLAREGLRLFADKARCYICHGGELFTDEAFHNTGVAWEDGALRDEGRARITGKRYHKGAFKTPTLREVANTAPYMHDGSIDTIEAVIDFYDRGGNPNPYLDENIVPLHLSTFEKRALAAFLRSLSGTVRDTTP
jgi:cytochrome c peroxidase